MRSTRLILLFGLMIFPTIIGASAPDSGNVVLPENDRLLMEVAFSALGELHVIGADIDADKTLRWATWSETTSQGVSVKLAILESNQKGLILSVCLEKQDAFEPDIRRITNWRYGKHPVLALTYRQGAEAELVELYGLDNDKRPVKLYECLGEQIEWHIGIHGETLLNVYTKPHGRLLPTCYRWQEKNHRMVRQKSVR